jgi:hypothetical protein
MCAYSPAAASTELARAKPTVLVSSPLASLVRPRKRKAISIKQRLIDFEQLCLAGSKRSCGKQQDFHFFSSGGALVLQGTTRKNHPPRLYSTSIRCCTTYCRASGLLGTFLGKTHPLLTSATQCTFVEQQVIFLQMLIRTAKTDFGIACIDYAPTALRTTTHPHRNNTPTSPHLCGDELHQAPVSPKLPPVVVVARCVRILLSCPLLQILELRLALIASAAAAISVGIQGRMHRKRLKRQLTTCCRYFSGY